MKKNFLRYTKIFEKNSTIPKYVSAVDALARQTNNFWPLFSNVALREFHEVSCVLEC